MSAIYPDMVKYSRIELLTDTAPRSSATVVTYIMKIMGVLLVVSCYQLWFTSIDLVRTSLKIGVESGYVGVRLSLVSQGRGAPAKENSRFRS